MIKYEFPEGEWDSPRSVIGYFSYFLETKYGRKLPSNQWGKCCRQVTSLLKDNTYEDLQYLLWGVANTESKFSNFGYLQYFTDKIDEYRELKKEYDEKEDEVKEEIVYEDVEVKSAKDRMKESQKKLLEEFGM